MSRWRFLLRPRWLLLHLVTVALIVAMVLLGRWQLTVSEHKHFSLRNFGYALQWWLFCGFAVFMWLRVVRDAVDRVDEPSGHDAARPFSDAEPTGAAPQSVQYRRYVPPSSSDASGAWGDDDPERAAYNDYLARLAAKSRGTGEGTAR